MKLKKTFQYEVTFKQLNYERVHHKHVKYTGPNKNATNSYKNNLLAATKLRLK